MSVAKPSLLAEALRAGKDKCRLSPRQHRVMRRLLACGTGELGHHVYRCGDCGKIHAVAHSCRDRHCPRCQSREAHRWLERQRESLLPVPYFHVVFTLPHSLNGLIGQNPKACLDLLFSAAGSTMLTFAENNLGAVPGITAVLHTWGQTLCRHYHIHMIVTGGGLSLSGDEWTASENPAWLFSTRALGEVYRARYLEGLEKLFGDDRLEFHGKLEPWREKDHFARQLRTLSRRKWNVYAKAPFGGPGAVLGYLSLYTHRIAISAGRVLGHDREAGTVRFRYRDYRKPGAPQRTMRLEEGEFARRFANHILPERFCKIRHYGIQSTRNRKSKIALCRYYLRGTPEPVPVEAHGATPEENASDGNEERTAETVIGKCPHCGSTELKLLWVTNTDGAMEMANERGPPER